MFFLILYVFACLAALGVGGLAGWCDFKGMTIPNKLSLIIIAAFFIAFGAAYMGEAEILGGLYSHFLAAVFVFIVTFLLFSLRLFGGGDSKLLTAYAFWFTPQNLIILLIYVSFLGALLGALSLILKNRQVFKNVPEGSWLARVQAGESVVPYGIPIVLGVFFAFVSQDYLAPAKLLTFLVTG